MCVQDLQGKKVLITAGATKEFIDPVRFISNASSGKMALALIKEAYHRGAEITVVTGTHLGLLPEKIKIIEVVDTLTMKKVVDTYVKNADIFIAAAAVADYRPAILLKQKLQSKNRGLKLELAPNPDILKSVALKSGGKPFIVGFALESGDHLKKAKVKFLEKGVDMLIANGVAALNALDSQVWIIEKGKTIKLPKMPKVNSAIRIFDHIVKYL